MTLQQYRPPHAVVVGIIVTVLILLGVIVAMAEEGTTVVAKDDATVWVDPRIPDEAEKVAALKQAYALAGNSFSGGPMIDLSQPPPKMIKTIPVPGEPPPEAAPAKPEKRASADLCQRHGMRKVVNGSTWRCRK